jgi:hypothetical protein
MPAGGENVAISESKWLYTSHEMVVQNAEVKKCLQETGTLEIQTTRMNMCQAVNNALDISLETDDKAGKV